MVTLASLSLMAKIEVEVEVDVEVEVALARAEFGSVVANGAGKLVLAA